MAPANMLLSLWHLISTLILPCLICQRQNIPTESSPQNCNNFPHKILPTYNHPNCLKFGQYYGGKCQLIVFENSTGKTATVFSPNNWITVLKFPHVYWKTFLLFSFEPMRQEFQCRLDLRFKWQLLFCHKVKHAISWSTESLLESNSAVNSHLD